jgi:hypothetical protein
MHLESTHFEMQCMDECSGLRPIQYETAFMSPIPRTTSRMIAHFRAFRTSTLSIRYFVQRHELSKTLYEGYNL